MSIRSRSNCQSSLGSPLYTDIGLWKNILVPVLHRKIPSLASPLISHYRNYRLQITQMLLRYRNQGSLFDQEIFCSGLAHMLILSGPRSTQTADADTFSSFLPAVVLMALIALRILRFHLVSLSSTRWAYAVLLGNGLTLSTAMALNHQTTWRTRRLTQSVFYSSFTGSWFFANFNE